MSTLVERESITNPVAVSEYVTESGSKYEIVDTGTRELFYAVETWNEAVKQYSGKGVATHWITADGCLAVVFMDGQDVVTSRILPLAAESTTNRS